MVNDTESILLKRKRQVEKKGNLKELAKCNKDLGDYYYEDQHHEKALLFYKEWLENCKSLNDKLNACIAHRMIGEAYAELRQFDDSLVYLNEYLRRAKALINILEEQRAQATLGRTYFLKADFILEEKGRTSSNYESALKKAKKAFSESKRICDDTRLLNEVSEVELATMKARVLLNLGLINEAQNNYQKSLELIKTSLEMCKKYNLQEDLFRTCLSLSAVLERQKQYDEALEYINEAAKVTDLTLKYEAKLYKIELLLRMEEWLEAKELLIPLYKTRHSHQMPDNIKETVEKNLKIVLKLLIMDEQSLSSESIEDNFKHYEILGDICVLIRAYSKAVYYYKKMLHYAEQTKDNKKISVALVCLSQTLRDDKKFQDAIPYLEKEIGLSTDNAEICKSYLALAGVLIDAGYEYSEIRGKFSEALKYAEKSNNLKIKANALSELIEYLENCNNVSSDEITSLRAQQKSILKELPSEKNQDSMEDEENMQQSDTDVIDINLEDFPELQPEEQKSASRAASRHKNFIKRNDKGETLLHVACIRDQVSQVEKLLEMGHPVNIRDTAGWTPLHEASNHGHIEIINLLIKANADVNDRGGKECGGITPLLDAASNGLLSVINLLLDKGADPNIVNDLNENVLELLDNRKEKVGELTKEEEEDFKITRKRLKSMMRKDILQSSKNSKSKPTRMGNIRALIYESDDEVEISKSEAEINEGTKRVSAAEVYRRAIESVQHPGRLVMPSNETNTKKITAPLLDSEDMLAEDWLEDDININKKKVKVNYADPISASNAKRKLTEDCFTTTNKSFEKSSKRQKTISPEHSDVCRSSLIDEDYVDNWESSSSCSDIVEVKNTSNFQYDEVWPKKKGRKHQLNLFKAGFTRASNQSRSPSPVTLINAEIKKRRSSEHTFNNFEQANSVTINLNVCLESFYSFDIKLHSPRDLGKSIGYIADIISGKFESETGCKANLDFKSFDGVVLTSDITLSTLINKENSIKLYGQLASIENRDIVERYKKVCDSHNIEYTQSMLKSLGSCENTSTFCLNAADIKDNELLPLLKCLRYQKNLHSLILSGGNLYELDNNSFNLSGRFLHPGEQLNFALDMHRNLYKLDLRNCNINSNLISNLDKLPINLGILDLSYNPLGSESSEKLFELIHPLQHLHTLNLCSCEISNFPHKINNKSLINLDISWNPLGGKNALNFLQLQLLSLKLSNTENHSFANINPSVIDSVFFKNCITFPTLEVLELSSCDITDLDVEKILSKTPSIKKIILSNNINITLQSLCTILNHKPALNYIDLSGCKLIEDPPPLCSIKLSNLQNSTLLVCMKHDIISEWEKLWQGKILCKKLPQSLVLFQPS